MAIFGRYLLYETLREMLYPLCTLTEEFVSNFKTEGVELGMKTYILKGHLLFRLHQIKSAFSVI
ncbi:hypothetical protein T4E_8709 [Trichinella pseudospiralis]|uniref:Uncharacterized protein n=1 Tax=Trichinella pseudospiralis TaxID=6337 RepID=A0A0V0XF27_TRIPS|nr:hypothetical protein T4E_8709 [Trichinella pseudospiralis]